MQDKAIQMKISMFHFFIIRLCDYILALILLIITLPIVIASIIWVKLIDGGQAIIVQQRMGKDWLPFGMYKLRTMRQIDGFDSPVTHENDPRFFFGSKTIRRYRIDELPQLINVMIGNMALVGPRPDSVALAEEYCESVQDYDKRYDVLPGLTGLAQVKVKFHVNDAYGTKLKVVFDRIFIKKLSLGLWSYIVFKTIKEIFVSKNAR